MWNCLGSEWNGSNKCCTHTKILGYTLLGSEVQGSTFWVNLNRTHTKILGYTLLGSEVQGSTFWVNLNLRTSELQNPEPRTLNL
jgi:hypothetical protein